MRQTHERATRGAGIGFGMVELAIAVAVVAVVGAVTIPRMSRGATAAGESALSGDLSTMRSALELYAQEHDGKYPAAAVAAQLTGCTDAAGTVNPERVRTPAYPFGPYLKAFPALPVGTNKGQTVPAYNTTGQRACGAVAGGWVYDGTTFWANCRPAEVDSSGTEYQTY